MGKIHCIGDSHTSLFSNYKSILAPSTYSWHLGSDFNAINIGPVLAYNTPNSLDVVKNLLYKVIKDGDSILFSFGEIDCRAQVKRRCDAENRSIDSILDDIITNYFHFINDIKESFINEIIIFGTIPCHLESPFKIFYDGHPTIFDCPKGSLDERNEIKTKFNELLKINCEKDGLRYLSIYDEIIGDGDINHDLYFDDIHLSTIKVLPIIQNKLNEL